MTSDSFFAQAAERGMRATAEKRTPRTSRAPSAFHEIIMPVMIQGGTVFGFIAGAGLAVYNANRDPVAVIMALALCGGSLAGFLASGPAIDNYRSLQWTEDYKEVEPVVAPVSPPPVFLKRPTGWASIPADVRDDRLPHFCRAALRDDILTEAGAGRFGFNRREWEVFRDWCIGQGLLEWRDDSNHKLGVQFAAGGRAGFETIGEYNE